MTISAILIDIDLISGVRRVSDIDLYVTDTDFAVDSLGNYIVDSSGNYLVSGGSVAQLYYKRCLENTPSITRQLPDETSGVISERSITLQLTDNHDDIDGTWIDIVDAEEIRGREIKLYRYVDGVPIFSCWGIIQGYEFSDCLELEVSLFDNDSLEVDLPKHSITADRFSDSALDSGKEVNICFGHCVDVPLYNIRNDIANDIYDYLIGYGPVQGIWEDEENNRGIRRNGQLVNPSEYLLYDGSQASPYPGFAFVRFLVEQRAFTGQMIPIFGDVKGLKLGGSTANRNFATVIYHLLTNTTWGLGQSANAATFISAAAYLSTNWLCDGFITSKSQAGDIVNDLLRCCRGKMGRNADGERTLVIAQPGASIASYGCNDGYYNNAETLRKYVASTSSLPKSITVRYGHEPGTTDYAYELSGTAFDDFGVDLEFELPFVEDPGTAKLNFSYARNLPVWSQVCIDAKFSPSEFRDRSEGDIISFTDPRRNISGDWIVWEITTNNRDDYRATLRKYHDNIYSLETLSNPTTLVIGGSSNDLNALVGAMTVGNSMGAIASLLIKAGGTLMTNPSPAVNGGVYISDKRFICYDANGNILIDFNFETDVHYFNGTVLIGNAIITSAMIGDLQVKSANIENLTVGTGKITNNAVTLMGYSYSAYGWSGNYADQILVYKTIVMDYAGTIYAWGSVTEDLFLNKKSFSGLIIYNGTTLTAPNQLAVFYRTNPSRTMPIYAETNDADGTWEADVGIVHTDSLIGAIDVAAGTYTVALAWNAETGASADQASVTVQGVKK